MADEKLNTGPGEEKPPEAPAPVTVDEPQAPAPEQTAAPTPQQEGPAQPEPGDVVVSFDKINELMNEKRQTARAEVEKEEAAKEPKEKTQEEPPTAGDDEPKKARRGRPPKEEKAEPAGKEAAKPRKGRPPKADKAAPGEATPTKRDKLSRSGKKTAEVKAAPEPEKAPPENAAPAPEQAPPEPAAPPRPVEEGKLVYLKLSEMHPFHTFRPHPFKVRDDAKMQETVASIKANGVMVPGLARPEKDGKGYENIDELNHLAHLLKELSPSERETLEAVMDSGQHCGSVQDLINLTQNLDCYDFHPGVDNEEMLGRLYVEDMESLEVPDNIKPYFDFEAYGQDISINENGHFAPGGYVTKVSDDFREVYHGPQDIPAGHRVFAYPQLSMREQMAAYQEIIDGSSKEGFRRLAEKHHEER